MLTRPVPRVSTSTPGAKHTDIVASVRQTGSRIESYDIIERDFCSFFNDVFSLFFTPLSWQTVTVLVHKITF